MQFIAIFWMSSKVKRNTVNLNGTSVFDDIHVYEWGIPGKKFHNLYEPFQLDTPQIHMNEAFMKKGTKYN